MHESLRLYIVRHGQTDLNRDKRFRGLTNAPLNDMGRDEARGAARLLTGSGLEVIYSSPMPRAVETAGIIADSLGCPVEEDGGFIDIDYGDWQGLTVEEVAAKFGAGAMEAWKSDPGEFSFPGGDHMRSVRSRLESSIGRIRANSRGSVAVVSHLAVIKVCFLVAMELPFDYFWKLGLENGSVSLFSSDSDGRLVLEWWNRFEPRGGA